MPTDMSEEPTTGGIVSRVMAMFRSNNSSDEGAGATASVIVSVQMETEEYLDPVQDPRFDFDPGQRQWRNFKRAPAGRQKQDSETGL